MKDKYFLSFCNSEGATVSLVVKLDVTEYVDLIDTLLQKQGSGKFTLAKIEFFKDCTLGEAVKLIG